MKLKLYMTVLGVALLAACSTLADAASNEKQPVTRTQIMKTTTTWDGQPINIAAIPRGAQAELTATLFELDANTKLPFHCHTYPVFGLLLEGRLQVETLTGETKIFEAGDPVSELQGRWHRGMTLDVPAKFVAFDLTAEGVEGNLIPMTEENKDACVK